MKCSWRYQEYLPACMMLAFGSKHKLYDIKEISITVFSASINMIVFLSFNLLIKQIINENDLYSKVVCVHAILVKFSYANFVNRIWKISNETSFEEPNGKFLWKKRTPMLIVLLLNILPKTYIVLSIFKSLSNTLDPWVFHSVTRNQDSLPFRK